MQHSFLKDEHFLRLTSSARFIYLIIKSAPESMKPLYISDLSEISGFKPKSIPRIMREINENFDIYTLLDSNNRIIQ